MASLQNKLISIRPDKNSAQQLGNVNKNFQTVWNAVLNLVDKTQTLSIRLEKYTEDMDRISEEQLADAEIYALMCGDQI